MSFPNLSTGLVGYSLRFDYLSETMPWRMVERATYEVYALDIGRSENISSGIQNALMAQLGIRSGDINVKTWRVPNSINLGEELVFSSKYMVEIETFKPYTGMNDLLSSVLYSGFTGYVIDYGHALLDFNEDFNFTAERDGSKNFNHNISFGLKSGDISTAKAIASGLFINEPDMGINVFIDALPDYGNANNYVTYAESYDLLKNQYSFTKQNTILPVVSGSYTYNTVHTYTLNEKGISTIVEKGTIRGLLDFNQALAAYPLIRGNSLGNCQVIYQNYRTLAGAGLDSANLAPAPIDSSYVYDKPNNTISYTIAYTNDPNISGTYSFLETLSIDKGAQPLVITLKHDYGITRLANITGTENDIMDDYYDTIIMLKDGSPIRCASFYQGSPYYTSLYQGGALVMTDQSISIPNRARTANASFSYTNDPTLNVTVNGVTFKKFTYSISNNEPEDIINEYKIINKSDKTSIVNYAYQSSPGTISIDMKGIFSRRMANIYDNPYFPRTEILALYDFARQKILESFNGITILSLTYYLSNCKFTVGSNSELSMTVEATYTLKKYAK
jgi:hypothetical protein